MGWFRRLFPAMKNLRGANNAVLAEHALGLVELVPENPFARQLAQTIIRTLQPLGGDDASKVLTFNREERLRQLNMIARALAYTQPPTLPGEEWLEIRNPFILEIGDDEIKFFAGQMQKKHGVSIVIPDRHFEIVNGVLTDPAVEEEGRPTLAIQRPGERWHLVDLREFTGGTVHLVQSEADRRWGVQIVWKENRPSYITWYNNETQARAAFTQHI